MKQPEVPLSRQQPWRIGILWERWNSRFLGGEVCPSGKLGVSSTSHINSCSCSKTNPLPSWGRMCFTALGPWPSPSDILDHEGDTSALQPHLPWCRKHPYPILSGRASGPPLLLFITVLPTTQAYHRMDGHTQTPLSGDDNHLEKCYSSRLLPILMNK